MLLRSAAFGATIRLLLKGQVILRIRRRRAMRRCKGLWLLVGVLSFASSISQVWGQVDHIVIAAGTDEDHALQGISNEQDAAKKVAMYQDFVQKFSSNPQAVAYGNWQLAQLYQTNGELDKALDYGDKALVGTPHNLDI